MSARDTKELTDALFEASRSLLAIAARSLAQLPPDVTVPQYRVLVVLSVNGPQRASALANELRIAPSSLTRLCDRLATRGYVERATPPTNRREVEIRVTERGQALVDELTAVRKVELKMIVDAIPASQRSSITTALERVVAAFAGSDEDDALAFGWSR